MKICPKCGKQFADDANFCPVDAARLVLVDSEANRDPLTERYELAERLGGATTGPVFRARDKQSGKAVAIKFVAPAVMAMPQVAQRIERELKQLERVETPAVARVYASGRKGDQLWIATEYLDGALTLAQAIGARGPIDARKAAELVEVMGEALIEAAKVGVVHRDLAPKNVLISGDQIKLINFSVPVPDRIPGVAEYVAPECFDGKPVDQRSNIYSLGAIQFFTLTGQPPFEGDLAAVRGAPQGGTIPPPLASSRAPVPTDVDALISRALERTASKRYLTVRQFIDEVTRVARSADSGAVIATPTVRAKARAELVGTLTGVPPNAADGENSDVIELNKPKPGFGPTATMTAPPAPAVHAAPQSLPAQVAAGHVATTPVAPAGPPASTIPGLAAAPPPAGSHAAAAAAAVPATAILGGAAAVGVATTMPQDTRSPWAPPAAGHAQPAAAHAHYPQPVPATAHQNMPGIGHTAIGQPIKPLVAAQAQSPLTAAHAVVQSAAASPAALAGAQAATTKKKDEGAGKGKFRETMWFKKGDLDVAAAEAAAEERARTGKDVATDKADSMPVEERYNDDGTITRGDQSKYSLKTGGTLMMQAIPDPRLSGSMAKVSENELIGEMKGTRTKLIVAVMLIVIVVAALVIAGVI